MLDRGYEKELSARVCSIAITAIGALGLGYLTCFGGDGLLNTFLSGVILATTLAGLLMNGICGDA